MAEHLPARLDHDGSVILRADIARRYAAAMDAALRQARHRHPEGQVPLDIEVAQEVLRLAATAPSPADGTETVAVQQDAAHLRTPGIATRAAGEHLGISDSGVRKLIRRGRLPAVRVGGIWWITEHDLDEYRKARKAA